MKDNITSCFLAENSCLDYSPILKRCQIHSQIKFVTKWFQILWKALLFMRELLNVTNGMKLYLLPPGAVFRQLLRVLREVR